MKDKARLLELLKKYSFELRDVTLASGQKSSFYIDCKQVALRGEGHLLIGTLFFDMMQQMKIPFAACSGMALGAVPLCSATSLIACQNGVELPCVIVRKEAKDHGTSVLIEGTKAVVKNSRVLLLEDVITTGGSVIKAVHALRNQGYVVDTVFALIDRDAGGKENLQKEGLTLHALFHISDFTN